MDAARRRSDIVQFVPDCAIATKIPQYRAAKPLYCAVTNQTTNPDTAIVAQRSRTTNRVKRAHKIAAFQVHLRRDSVKQRFSESVKSERLQVPPNEQEEALLHELRLPTADGRWNDGRAPVQLRQRTPVPLKPIKCSQQYDRPADLRQKGVREEGFLLEGITAAILFCIVVIFYYSLFLTIEQALPLRIFQ